MKEPNFFIIGAPKCGTTSVVQWLAQHPNVFLSKIKEPHYFSKDIWRKHRLSFEEYLNLFVEANHRAVGEGSTRYLYSEDAVPAIEETFPGSKYVVLVRNPIEMLHSLHNHLVFLDEEDCTDFATAWALRKEQSIDDLRRLNESDPDSLKYDQIGLLGHQVQRLLRITEPARINVVVFDDLKDDPWSVFFSVQEFLGLDLTRNVLLDCKNASMARRSEVIHKLRKRAAVLRKQIRWIPRFGLLNKIDHFNRIKRARAPLPNWLTCEMQDYFKEDVQILGEILGRDLSSWLENDGRLNQ